ncbi:uncharacterized protein LOC119007985 isoform X4 [Acanthopagrus latus]|uniref:uncharacterized protein LOC119007985 isoform X4 n=1 Tax=Acanthopagrus latus TaxID=8177 RepID=UPI00187CD01E|nr:uncharacterized protein LOC119007985 isoform X4 [Acanthopagrus latus]XP_036933890.1 uncharacterized protein LOC119007985 isoform X4 [Acanthopagrus latus]
MNPEPHLGRHLIQIYCHLLADSSTTSTQKHNRSGSWQRTAYEPWFGSQVGSSQREEPPADRNMVGQPQPPSDGRRDKRGNKRSKVKTRSVLKVKLPTLNKKVTKEEKTPRRWTLEPTINKSKPTASRGGAQCVDTVVDTVGRDVFYFSQSTPSKAINEKEKAKLAVLRTISRVLEENRLLRQRLVALSQAI